MIKKYFPIIIIFLLFLLLIIFLSFKSSTQANDTPSDNNLKELPSVLFNKIRDTTTKRCPADAKRCEDGTYVSRVAPSCSFTLCPEEKIYEKVESVK